MNAHANFMDNITEDDVIEAEQDVLSCILANNETLNDCGLEDVDFVDELHQSVFSPRRSSTAVTSGSTPYLESHSSTKTRAKACRRPSSSQSCRCTAPILKRFDAWKAASR
jgi:hypothetical protein